MGIIEFLKVVFLGIVEGLTEWLPISSTGHLILVQEFIKLNVSSEFWEMFEVVIQLGAILAVVVLFFKKLWPFTTKEKYFIKKDTLIMWLKIAVACIPAAIVGVLFDDKIDELFYHPIPIALALIIVGIIFIAVENNKPKAKINNIADITFKTALLIGLAQLVAAVFPGVSRSGATIIGGLLLGISRETSAEFTFFLAIPVMFGASLLKLVKFGFNFTSSELVILLVGMITAFIVSILTIRFLIGYIKKNDFKPFGWYRIMLGLMVLIYFLIIK